VKASAQRAGADLVDLLDSHFGELWLFAVDVGAGLSTTDAIAIRRFLARGGGLLFTRDQLVTRDEDRHCALQPAAGGNWVMSQNEPPHRLEGVAPNPHPVQGGRQGNRSTGEHR